MACIFLMMNFSFHVSGVHFKIVRKVNRLDWKDKVNFIIYDVTTWKLTVTIHIFTNISRSKSDQTMTLGQLIWRSTGNIFLEKLYAKCCGETIFRPFSSFLSPFSPCLIFCTIFEGKYLSCCILLTGQSPLFGCLYLVRY